MTTHPALIGQTPTSPEPLVMAREHKPRRPTSTKGEAREATNETSLRTILMIAGEHTRWRRDSVTHLSHSLSAKVKEYIY